MAGILEQRLPKRNKDTGHDPEPETAMEAAGAGDSEEEYSLPAHEEPEIRPRISKDDAEFLDGLESIMSEDTYRTESRRKRRVRRAANLLMCILCIYMVVLIYGAAITEYRYGEDGEITPVVLSVEEIGARNEYSTVLSMYLQCRNLYETILTLDYRMAAGVEDTMGIAPEYETALDTVSTLGVQIDASDISSRYNQIKNMLLTWVQTHVAAYCQYMSAAISQNDSNAAAEAIAARQVVNDYFQMITLNIVTIGDDLDWDTEDLKEWSPDAFVQETIEGAQ